MSQPALSRCIQGAEDAVGGRLFDRNTRNVSLTPAGSTFLPIARRLLSDFQSSVDEVTEHMNGDRGTLSIAALPSMGNALLPEVMCEFACRWPGVNVTIVSPHNQIITELVAGGQVDLGITMKPTKSDKLQYEHLLDDEFVLICSSDHTLASMPSCGWEVFEHFPYIALSATTSMSLLTKQVFSQLHMDVTPAYQIDGLRLIGKLISAGLGITAIPRLVLPQLSQTSLQIIPLHTPTVHRSLGIVTRQGRTLSILSTNFLELLRRSIT
jgi:DNA-binding transcriptional LysR family regulator